MANCGSDGIRANVVCPGAINTDMLQQAYAAIAKDMAGVYGWEYERIEATDPRASGYLVSSQNRTQVDAPGATVQTMSMSPS